MNPDVPNNIKAKPIPLQRKLLLILVMVGLVTIFVLNASQPGRAVEGCPQDCVIAADRRPGAMRVLSLNMLHGFPLFKNLRLRLDLIAAEIKRLDADVVLLQEVPWTVGTGNVADALAQELGYNYLYYRANGNKNLILFEEGEAIFSRFPLTDPVVTELKPRKGFFDSRVSLGATVVTPWGELSLFVAHLTNQSLTAGAGQAKSLRSFVEANSTGLAVVAGDFNAQEDSPQIEELASVWTDTYRVAHSGEAGLTCCIDDLHASPEEQLEERIDYLFLVNQREAKARMIGVKKVFDQPFMVDNGWQWASDHEGLMVEIEP